MAFAVRLAVSFGVLLLFGCSAVTKLPDEEDDPDGGAAVCLGEVDQSGACVCGPRATGDLCDECLPGWSDPARGCPQFSDDFERDEFGPAWEFPDLGAPPAEIVSGRACGTTQSIVVLAAPIASRDFTVRYTFFAEAAGGRETGFVFADNDTFLPTFLAGCDGGGDSCLAFIGRFGEEPLVQRDSELLEQSDAVLELSVQGDEVSLRITQTGIVPEVISTALPAGFETLRVGVLVGREGLSCVDDFSVTIR